MEKEEVRSLHQYIEMFQSTMKKETVPQDVKFTLKDTLFALHESKACNLIEICIGFTGGQVVFDNDVVGSVISCEYTGDTIDIPEDKTFDTSSMVIRVYKRKADEVTLIPVSAVNFIKVRQTNDINWRHEWEQLSQEKKDLLSDYYQKIGREYYLQNQK